MFTAAYVKRFNDLETAERAKLKAHTAMPVPKLGEYNACARIFIRALQDIGATPERIIDFLKSIYEPFGITVADGAATEAVPRTYTAKQIAERLGINSLSGKPHPQAVSCILNENLLINETHKSAITIDCGNHIGVSVRYDDYAIKSLEDWIIEYDFPEEVYGFDRTYNIRYAC